MAHARTCIDIVRAERCAHHLLDDVNLFVGASRGSDATDRVDAELALNRGESFGSEIDSLVPSDDLPLVIDGLSNHGLDYAIFMTGVPPSKPPFHARVAGIRPTGLVRNHSHEFVSAEFGHEGAADPAVGTRGFHLARGDPEVDDGLLLQRGRWARLHTGSAGDALTFQEGDALTRRNLGCEAATGDRQGECSLHLRTRAYAPTAGDALALVECEVGIRIVFRGIQVIGAIRVAHIP